MVINVYSGVRNADPRVRGRSIKKQMGEKIYDPKREKEVLERLRLRSRNKGLLKERDLEKIFTTIIKVCRQSQK